MMNAGLMRSAACPYCSCPVRRRQLSQLMTRITPPWTGTTPPWRMALWPSVPASSILPTTRTGWEGKLVECRADAECSLSMLQLSGQTTSTLAIDDADNTTMDGDNTTMENGALAKRSGFKHFAYYPYRMGGQTCQRGTSNASPVETSP